MATLQVLLTDKQLSYAKDMLVKAQGSFQMNGEKFTLGRTLMRLLEEWCKNKGYIKNTLQDKKILGLKQLIENDPDEHDFILDLIRMVVKQPNEVNTRRLHQYVLKLDPNFRPSKERPLNRELVDRARELV